jgi:hypothetical protein
MPNRLANATSPYLLQHADNPVDWWEWGPEAFEEARRRGIPISLSVRRLPLVPRGSPVAGCQRTLTKPQVRRGVAVQAVPMKAAVGHRFRGLMHHSRA